MSNPEVPNVYACKVGLSYVLLMEFVRLRKMFEDSWKFSGLANVATSGGYPHNHESRGMRLCACVWACVCVRVCVGGRGRERECVGVIYVHRCSLWSEIYS